MSKFFDAITPELAKFIGAQPVFFVATAAPGARINLSPKGMDTFRVLDEKRVAYLDLTGSGNETAAHLLHDGRITIMFCSFDSNAEIARIYGRGAVVRPSDERWTELMRQLPQASWSAADNGDSRRVGDDFMRLRSAPDGRDDRARHARKILDDARRRSNAAVSAEITTCAASTACPRGWPSRLKASAGLFDSRGWGGSFGAGQAAGDGVFAEFLCDADRVRD